MIRSIPKSRTLLAALCLGVVPMVAQVTLVKKGIAQSRIIVADTPADRQAGELLNFFTEKITGARLPLTVADASFSHRKGDVLIGNAQHLPASLETRTGELTEDGFLLSTEGDVLRIVSGGDKGSIYGVVNLLEQYCGVDYWGENEYACPTDETLTVPALTVLENPAFRYRQSQFYGMQNDSIYRMWNRLEEPVEMFAGGYWVHTFDRLLPSDVYGESHPEYYSYFKGKRHPGKASQWCLTNPDVLEIVSARVDSIFRANPGLNMISVSQNDGNYTNCTCASCKALDEEEGALSGSLIHFMNRLAERFPDKEFSTLAYLYTMKAPKNVKPLPNVSVMLCDIDCDREEIGRASCRERVSSPV